jgi:hypothetical protein
MLTSLFQEYAVDHITPTENFILGIYTLRASTKIRDGLVLELTISRQSSENFADVSGTIHELSDKTNMSAWDLLGLIQKRSRELTEDERACVLSNEYVPNAVVVNRHKDEVQITELSYVMENFHQWSGYPPTNTELNQLSTILTANSFSLNSLYNPKPADSIVCVIEGVLFL